MVQAANPVQVQLIIAGRVQGVYFRASAVSEAQKLGLTGWVKNRPDGSVQAVAEGPREKLDQLIAWCHQGPGGAKATSANVQWAEAQNAFLGFAIRR
jgi:acylphosphatase